MGKVEEVEAKQNVHYGPAGRDATQPPDQVQTANVCRLILTSVASLLNHLCSLSGAGLLTGRGF